MVASPLLLELINAEKKLKANHSHIQTAYKPFKNGLDLITEDYSEHIISRISISKICIKYRLSCMDIAYYKPDIHEKAWETVSEIEQKYNVRFTKFKVITPEPSIFTKKTNPSNGILLACMPNDTYLFIYKWGNEFEKGRQFWAWCLKNLEIQTLICVLLGIGIVCGYTLLNYYIFNYAHNIQNLLFLVVSSTTCTTLVWYFACFALKIRPSTQAWNHKFTIA